MADEDTKSGQQEQAESEIEGFQQDLGPFVVSAETTRMPMVFMNAKDPDRPIIFVNDAFLDLTGYTRQEVLEKGFNSLMALGGDPEGLAQLEAMLAGTSDIDPEICYCRRDGSVFWASVFISPVPDDSGTIVQYFASLVDLTEHRQERDRLRLLLDELNHRTQNTLATVLAIARQTLSHMADRETFDTLEGRILTLAKTHNLLGAENWYRVGLREVLEQVLQPFGSNDGQHGRFTIENGTVSLTSKQALTLAMVFHELATNAVKHGAHSNEDAGQVDISWKIEAAGDGEQLRLRWQESGGPPVTPPGIGGFGSRLIEHGLAQDLDGEVHLAYEPAGVVCEIVMPMSQAVEAHD
jgi:PAS domain S-box-containing protein